MGRVAEGSTIMSVKRLKLVDEFHGYIRGRLKELFNDFSHAQHQNYKDIITHLEFSHKVTKELLERAKKYQKKDREAKK
jgi:hypothetical protein